MQNKVRKRDQFKRVINFLKELSFWRFIFWHLHLCGIRNMLNSWKFRSFAEVTGR